jgi:hypothetical protein
VMFMLAWPQKLLHVLRMLAYHEEYCSARVLKIMEPDRG